METRNRKVALWIIIAIVLIVLCCAAVAITATIALLTTRSIERGWSGGPTIEERTEQSFDVGDMPRLVVDNFAGRVSVRVGQPNAMSVIVTKRAPSQEAVDEIDVQITPQDDGLQIIARRPAAVTGNRSVQLVVTVPEGTSVEIRTGAGEIDVRGISGDVQVETGAGDIRVEDTTGSVDGHTGAGSIDVAATTGVVRVDTGAGSINYSGQPEGDCRFETGAGSIEIALPADASVQLDLTTAVGDVESDFDVDGDVSRREIRGTIGTGEQASIVAHTGTGSINLVRR